MLLKPAKPKLRATLWFLACAAFAIGIFVALSGTKREGPAARPPPARQDQKPLPVSGSPSQTPPATPPQKPPANPNPTTPSAQLPAQVLLKVPFTPQAPTANWDELHNEACEEASAIMANAYFSATAPKDSLLDPGYVEGEIQKLSAWQQETFGYHLDITSPEVVRMLRENYGLKGTLVWNYTERQLKEALASGKLVIVSVNGRLLGNPYFRQPGPIYHMLVLKGYTKDGFITNDPGTRRGQSYPYSFETIRAAAAEWDHGIGSTDLSKKVAIIVEP